MKISGKLTEKSDESDMMNHEKEIYKTMEQIEGIRTALRMHNKRTL